LAQTLALPGTYNWQTEITGTRSRSKVI